ncbi:MAG: hypothetical protein CMM50_12175 [Rhodospirillaceae bacterium]|nr:hypothetical protein [Rhodospirillaceae bacterium]
MRDSSRRWTAGRFARCGTVAVGLFLAGWAGEQSLAQQAAPADTEESDEGAVTNPYLGDFEAIAAGKRVYRSHCIICHLKSGGRGPNLFRTDLTDEKFLDIVVNGVEGALMPAFGTKLTLDEIWQVNAYVKSRDRY